MAMLAKTVVLYTCFAVALGASVIVTRDLRIKPISYRDVVGCYIFDVQKVIPYGAKIQSTKFCGLYTCGKDGLRAEVCDLNLFRPKLRKDSCSISENLEKPYPDCCPEIKCEDKGLLGILLS